ncbi:conserved Plasmodium protein, unknown function [Plasmodium knowlesi strain H]|uniref:Uncharacterized protein n=3 Tax=Plasmodium knowlesi TaxID=5850 RepID=A0A5K1VB86_PLAKH|nr:conserved Plasmodium protein, unknown function [Plasmodium knowlesi strain H]OTN67012.1 Uncharacterized protein PKNOH_S07441300 [Plasmodium knowlesi]CAA9988542.1 conserved Plasmodium protein, unknown function [Plasmodium knowlesi strain H]SBO21325.1 conserved Plasmodium protein, unknown function [Plasmodium knowlesi strain H]SBO21780.1 conserved Plasmodium protein, unknown function [Plasmodium knowlesi strain H]VVS78016.1 conserved Plasmodium protein, unknown function [Plasmodium knowlesi s|eukprot:XP_002259518.1 hypothetical protein, conserved in Plasmodium species [Plasmodium knowlesi strain H]
MHNPNRKNFSNIQKKKNVNYIFQIRKDRSDQTPYTHTTYSSGNHSNSMVNPKFPTNGNRRKEMNDETIYGYSNNEVKNKILDKENMIKNKVYNNASSSLKKKNYYEKLNATNNEEKEFVKQKNAVLSEHIGKNYIDKEYGDNNNLTKDRSKFRRIGYCNEENNLKTNSAYDDVNNAVASKSGVVNVSGIAPHRRFNDLKAGPGGSGGNNNEEAMNNAKGGAAEGVHNQKQNFDHFGKKNLMYIKSNNDNNANYNYSKMNRNQNKYGNTNFRDHPQGTTPVGTTGVATQGVAPQRPLQSISYMGRDKLYQKNEREHNTNSNMNNVMGGKGSYKNDTLGPKDKILNEDKFIENNKMSDNDVGTGLGHNEFQRNKNVPNNKGGMMNGKNIYKKVTNHSKHNGDMVVDHERATTNYTLKQYNPNMRRNIYTNYPHPSKNEKNMPQHKYTVDKDGGRKKEHQNFSLSTIDSNYSHQNTFDKKFGSKFVDPHIMDRMEGIKENPADFNARLGEIKGDGKKYPKSSTNNNENGMNASDRGVPLGGNEEDEYVDTSEYNKIPQLVGVANTNNCVNNSTGGNNAKQSFRNDAGSVPPNGNGNATLSEKQRLFDRAEMNAPSKSYEYNTVDSGKISPEFGNENTNRVICEGRGGNVDNANDVASNVSAVNVSTVNLASANRMSKGNVGNGTHHMRDKTLPQSVNPYGSSPKYEGAKHVRKRSNNMQGTYKGLKGTKYDPENDEDYQRYPSSEDYNNNSKHVNNFFYENVNDNEDELMSENAKEDVDLGEKDYNRRREQNYANRNMNYKYYPERTMKRLHHDTMVNYPKDSKKRGSYGTGFKTYSGEYYPEDECMPQMNPAYEEYPEDDYPDASYSDMENPEDTQNYQRSYSHDSKSEKGALTIIRLPAENKKQVKKKKKNIVSYGKSLVEMYSTAIPINEQVDPYALKALSKNENLNEKIYALIPKSVVEVSEYDDVTHVTLQSASPLFVNQNDNVKQHIITSTNYQKSDDIPNIASCVVPESDESLKESLEKSKESLSGGENDKNLKSIIRGTSLRNKSGSSLSVKFMLSQGKNENKSKSLKGEDSEMELNKKIEDHILSEELRNLKIDKTITEKKRASIFHEPKTRLRQEKKNEPNNKVVLDSNKVKNATEIKLKKIQHVTGLLEKYDIPNPFESYTMDPIDYSQLAGKNNSAKLMSLAHMVSNNYYKYILKSMEKEEIKEVFNEKRKKMILKLIALLGNQINSEIKKKFSEANAVDTSKESELKKEDNVKPKMSPKEREIKVEEHNLICQYWEKQSECMSMLIKEWNKICEILESINVDPNNMVSSLISLYGEKTVSDFHLSFDQIKESNIELDVNVDDISIPNIGESPKNKFDPSGLTVASLIQDMKWDVDLEFSLNQIREEWKNENKQNKKLIQKKIVEGIKHRIGLLDYLNNVEVNLNAFAKIIEGRMISNDDVKSQLRSMQDLNEDGILSKLLENLECNKMDINADSFRTPTSFFVSHHLPMTMCSLSDKSKMDDVQEGEENGSSGDGNGSHSGEERRSSICDESGNGSGKGSDSGKSNDNGKVDDYKQNEREENEKNSDENMSEDRQSVSEEKV